MEQSPTTGMSFLAIQHSQQARVAPPKDKRSLREIQEEEHALQEEADFLIWWTAEEERLQQEAEAEVKLALVESQSNHHRLPSSAPPTPRKSSRNPKHKIDKKDRGESGAKASAGASAGPSAGSGQASMMHRVPSTGESSGAGRQPPGTDIRANHPPRKQPRKPRTADS